MDGLNELINSYVYKEITSKVCKGHPLKDDLHSEAILVIIEKQTDFSEIRNLKHFFAKIVWLTWHSNKFQQKYFTNFIPLNIYTDIELESEKPIIYNEIIKMVDDNYTDQYEYYEKNLLKLYVNLGDCRAISRQTNIPYRTVANDIKQIKDKLRVKHNEENTD